MARFPEYVGPAAFGVKMGAIVPGSDLLAQVVDRMKACHQDQLLDSGDVICITESVVARAQNNYVTVDDIAREVRTKLCIQDDSRIGVVFPIASRNRFSMIMEAVAKAVPNGEVVVQCSWPTDEVGNQIIPEEFAQSIGRNMYDAIGEEQMQGHRFEHPITGVDYIALYRDLITSQGAKAVFVLSNDPKTIMDYDVDGVIAADIHTRHTTEQILRGLCSKVITLVDLCSSSDAPSWSEWGLLGSNMSSRGKLKLAPHHASKFAVDVQQQIRAVTDKQVEVIIYGDGAYKDPTTGIYELADPKPVFGATDGFCGLLRQGVKYKYLADVGYADGKSIEEIEALVKEKQKQVLQQDQLETEGTTPRQMEDVVASLADLVSGSADAGTPVVVVKGFLG